MSRIQTTFTNLANNKRKALIPFITAGDPHPDMTVNLHQPLDQKKVCLAQSYPHQNQPVHEED